MNEPSWLGFDVLPGGFRTNTPLAGGEVEPWEREEFRANRVDTRLALNRLYCTPAGRETLLRHLAQGSYRLSQPEEAALMVAACRPRDPALAAIIEPFMADVRFYPQTLSRGYRDSPFGIVSRYTCGDALSALENYKLPLEILRKRESMTLWHPLQERMLKALSETTEDGWPFQAYPPGWSDQARTLVSEIEFALGKEVVCHYPQRLDSDFRRLLSALKMALSNPSLLAGRDVAFCKCLLEKARQKQHPSGRRHADLPGEEVLRALSQLKTELADLPKELGLDPTLPFLQDLPKAVKKKMLRSRRGTLGQLRDWGVISSLEVMAKLVPKALSGVFTGDHATLVGRCYRAFSVRPRLLFFEDLPWIKPIWETPSTEKLLAVGRQVLECWWTHFPQYKASQSLSTQLKNLSRWLNPSQNKDWHDSLLELTRTTRPQIDVSRALKMCRAYREEQLRQDCPKPYQRQRRDKKLRSCVQQERLLEHLFFTRKGP